MTYDVLIALAMFCFVSSITPGPNNLMLMASGANFGFRRSIAHMLGISIGFTIMIVLIGVGLISVFDRFPITHTILKIVSAIYMLWLAWKIANSGAPKGKSDLQGSPMTFLQAAAFQWVNPKAWAMALTAISVYAPGQNLHAVGVVALVFGIINLPSVSTWTIMGQQLRRLLTNPQRLRAFNWTMAAALVVSIWPVIAP